MGNGEDDGRKGRKGWNGEAGVRRWWILPEWRGPGIEIVGLERCRSLGRCGFGQVGWDRR